MFRLPDLDYWEHDLDDVIPEHKKSVSTRCKSFIAMLNGHLQN